MRARIVALVALVPLAALLTASAAAAADGTPRRFAIIAGASEGGPTRTTLRYATSDAREVARVLRRLGGVALDDLLMVAEPDAAGLRAALARVATETGKARRAGSRVELFLYFSGHSDEAGLLLGGSKLPYAELRAELERVPADVRVAILDSCASGAFTRAKGGVHRPPFLLDASSRVKGHAFLTSSAADEASQESDRLKGSFFTHALLSGLRGGADATGDGVVTLNEAYQFAFRETLARTETTQAGPQHATYDIGLVGSGDVVMTDLRRADAVLAIPASVEGTIFVHDAAGRLVAELRKVRGAGVELALEEGRYELRVSREQSVTSASVELAASARVTLDPSSLVARPLEITALRGDDAAAPAPTSAPTASPPASPAPAVAPAGVPAAAPTDAPRPHWLAVSVGSGFSESTLRGEMFLEGRVSVGTWPLSFLGVEVSAGYGRTWGAHVAHVPVQGSLGPPYTTDAKVRDTVTLIPFAATVRLAVPAGRVRPYLLVGGSVARVQLTRELLEKVENLALGGAYIEDGDLAPGAHAGLGASFTLGPRLVGVLEARYTMGGAKMTWQEDLSLGTLDLAAAHVAAGFEYAF